jgi:hypothetical protein
MGEHRAREEFAVLGLVEPGALDVEQAKPGKPGEGEGIDGELRERAVGAGEKSFSRSTSAASTPGGGQIFVTRNRDRLVAHAPSTNAPESAHRVATFVKARLPLHCP